MSNLTDLHPEHRQIIAAGRAGKVGGQTRSVLVLNEILADDVIASLKQLSGVSNVIKRKASTQFIVEWLE